MTSQNGNDSFLKDFIGISAAYLGLSPSRHKLTLAPIPIRRSDPVGRRKPLSPHCKLTIDYIQKELSSWPSALKPPSN